MMKTIVGLKLLLGRIYAVPIDPSVGVLTGLIAIIASFWNIQVVVLMLLVIWWGGMDLSAGARRARLTRDPATNKSQFDRQVLDDGAWGKVFYFIGAMSMGVMGDSLLILFAKALDFSWAAYLTVLTPATCASLIARLQKEYESFKENVEETPGGRDALWWMLPSSIIDGIRWRFFHPQEGPKPERRWKDGKTDAGGDFSLTAEEREFITERRVRWPLDNSADPTTGSE